MEQPNYPYLLGRLEAAVAMFLAGAVDRDFLARVLSEVEAESAAVVAS